MKFGDNRKKLLGTLEDKMDRLAENRRVVTCELEELECEADEVYDLIHSEERGYREALLYGIIKEDDEEIIYWKRIQWNDPPINQARKKATGYKFSMYGLDFAVDSFDCAVTGISSGQYGGTLGWFITNRQNADIFAKIKSQRITEPDLMSLPIA